MTAESALGFEFQVSSGGEGVKSVGVGDFRGMLLEAGAEEKYCTVE